MSVVYRSVSHFMFSGSLNADLNLQSFHPPKSLRDFYRYIRIDFLSHYSNEYYCPVSLLRVYGLTHMEQWKWEVWESEGLAKLGGAETSPIPAEIVNSPEPIHVPVPEDSISEKRPLDVVAENGTMLDNNPTRPTVEHLAPTEAIPSAEPMDTFSPTSAVVSRSLLNETSIKFTEVPTTHPETRTAHDSPLSTKGATASTQHASASPETANAASEDSATAHVSSTSGIPIVTTSSYIAQQPMPPMPPPTTGGESIYRTIMNRLTALEANNTLYARYVEEQTAGVRIMIARLGEEVGRLEGIVSSSMCILT